MSYQTANLETCHEAVGVVVVIDVCRAFTTAAFAFAAGAERIILTETVEEALDLRAQIPGSLVMGESGGMPVEGFDFWNSPVKIAAAGPHIAGRTLIQRTSAGTQGIVRARSAEHLFAASLVVAAATARAVRTLSPEQVTFVLTGVRATDTASGLEDAACADYLLALLQDQQPEPAHYLTWKEIFLGRAPERMPVNIQRQFAEDVELCSQIDHFDFAMKVERKAGLFEMRPLYRQG